MNFTGSIVIAQSELSESSTPVHEPGTQAVTTDGRVFRYVHVGAANLAQGTLVSSPASVADHISLVPTAAAVGADSLSVTLGNTAVTADKYRNGLAIVSESDGAGYKYTVETHKAADANASVTLTLQRADTLVAAVTANSRVDLISSPYRSVVTNPTTAVGAVVGAAVYPIQSDYYGWVQTRGAAALLIEGAISAGTPVGPSATVAGAVANTASDGVGTLLQAGVDGKYKAVFLDIE